MPEPGTITVAGTVRDARTGETLPGAHAYIPQTAEHPDPPQGTTTDGEGRYTLAQLHPGSTIMVTYVGYEPEQYVVPDTSGSVVHSLHPGVNLPEFEVVYRPTVAVRRIFIGASLVFLGFLLASERTGRL